MKTYRQVEQELSEASKIPEKNVVKNFETVSGQKFFLTDVKFTSNQKGTVSNQNLLVYISSNDKKVISKVEVDKNILINIQDTIPFDKQESKIIKRIK